VNIEDYGAFLEIVPGVEGLVHVSEISWSNQPVNARDYFQLDKEFEAKIVTIDREERKMSLSLKQLQRDPWTDIETRFPNGSRHTGVVKNLTPYGVFVELEDGIGGMVHISDLSWTKRYSHPSEFTSIGAEIEVVVLEIDKEGRKLSLGHKQIEENPWDTFESIFPVGSYHEALVVRRDDKGAIVQLPYGLEAFAPIKHIRKEDGSTAGVEETLTVKVLEFNRDDKRILVSHQRYLEDIKREAEEVVKKEERNETEQTERAVQSQNTKVERATLGELDVFSQLKEQLQGAANRKAAEAFEKAAEKENAPVAKETDSTLVAEAEEKTTVDVETGNTTELQSEPGQPEVEVEDITAEEVPVKDSVEEEVKEEEVSDVEEVVVEVKAAKSKTKGKSKKGGDDLKKIEGIGPKLAEILTGAGIRTYAELALAKEEELRAILESAGSRYKMFDPTTWPEQAGLAAEGKWDELKALQGTLSGGRK
jgi:ribosomal protein S1/predicted flap endonuclease-1-like 5' DNA nuclease